MTADKSSPWFRAPEELVWIHRLTGDRVTVHRVGSFWVAYYRKTGVVKYADYRGDQVKAHTNWEPMAGFLRSMGIEVA